MTNTQTHRRLVIPFCAALLAAIATSGCGTVVTTTFPHQFRDASGRPITLEEIEAITNDVDLNDEDRREALRALGLDDEQLIDALLDL